MCVVCVSVIGNTTRAPTPSSTSLRRTDGSHVEGGAERGPRAGQPQVRQGHIVVTVAIAARGGEGSAAKQDVATVVVCMRGLRLCDKSVFFGVRSLACPSIPPNTAGSRPVDVLVA